MEYYSWIIKIAQYAYEQCDGLSDLLFIFWEIKDRRGEKSLITIFNYSYWLELFLS